MAEQQSKVLTVMCFMANFVISIAIVLVNKQLYRKGFPNMTLTFMHFVVTTVGMLICQQCGMFKFKRAPLLKMAPIALTFCGWVVLTNLSLMYNTVGTYQVMKSLVTPCAVVIQALFYGRTFSLKVKLSMLPILVGVYLNSYFDIQFSLRGIIIAGIGVVVTSLYQVWVNEKQREFEMNAMQLLMYQAPLSAVFLASIIPIMEPVFSPGGIFSIEWHNGIVMLVIISATMAFGINLTIYWIIGTTSPLTYNMASQFKTSAVLTAGFIFFKDPITFFQFIGICLTFIGVFMYSWVRIKEQENILKEEPPLVTVVPSTDEPEEVKVHRDEIQPDLDSNRKEEEG